MPIRDQAARLASLLNDYGPDAAADAPTYHDAALFAGDPMLDPLDGGGVEVTGGGYARVRVDPADWVDDGVETLTATLTFPDSTGEWDEATHWALYGSDGNWWDCGELADSVQVTGAGGGPIVQISLFYGDALTTDEEP